MEMIDWLQAVDRLRATRRRCVLITVAKTLGSVPRDAGAKMVASEDAAFGTIGGGRLEYEALGLAREMLAGGASTPQLRRFGLGPSLGQCCGGSAHVLFEPVPEQPEPWEATLRELAERREPAVLVTAIGKGAAEKCVVSAGSAVGVLHDPRRHAEALQAAQAMLSDSNSGVRLETAGDGVMLLSEPVRPDGLHVVLFGAGHVGRALVRVLGEVPCRVTWVDGRSDEFPRDLPRNVTVECTEMPQYAVDRAPPGAAFLVMTHSHALDLTLCDKILRRADFAYCGLIGSATKRAKFIRRLRARGLPDQAIERMVCPIGIAGLSGKHPGEIAVAVTAQLLLVAAAGARSSHAGAARVAP